MNNREGIDRFLDLIDSILSSVFSMFDYMSLIPGLLEAIWQHRITGTVLNILIVFVIIIFIEAYTRPLRSPKITSKENKE